MRRAAGGFTLLELMITLSILGILVALAIPGFGQLSATTKVKSASTELYLAMIRARSEAVKRNRAVAVVATSGSAADWQSGWQVIADANNDGDFLDVASNDDRLISEQGTLQRVAISMAATNVVFRPTGRVSGAPPEFDVASDDPDHADIKRCISSDLTGRPYIRQEAC